MGAMRQERPLRLDLLRPTTGFLASSGLGPQDDAPRSWIGHTARFVTWITAASPIT
jgi:hypothetical protein